MNTPTSVVSGVDFISVPTRNDATAAAFYGSVLGLRCSAVYERVPGGEFEAGSLTLQVIDAEAISRELQPHRFPIALHVEDIEAARAELGVSFTHALDCGVCQMAFFEDPDGNALLLHHRYAPRGADA
jgi:catechol 2,3-dioxygenase-like lactoylglutathione lyase family enzyme